MAFSTDGFLGYTDLTQNTSGITETADLGAVTRKYDIVRPSTTTIWSDSNPTADWQILYSPVFGEGFLGVGEIWVIIEDELNGEWGFQVWEFDSVNGTITLKSDDNDWDSGNATLGVQFQFNSGNIEIANDGDPTAGHYLKAYTHIETEGIT